MTETQSKPASERMPLAKRAYLYARHQHKKSVLFEEYDYGEAYRRLMAWRLQAYDDPTFAVGGSEDGVGQLQFDFLRERGLASEDRMLDVGCGVLRGGQHFIDYLEPGNYAGMDISGAAIGEGRATMLEDYGVDEHPLLVVNRDLQFRELEPLADFDVVLAQSVWTHLPLDTIEECIANVDRVLADDGVFYTTFNDEPQDSPKDFGYPPEDLEALAGEYGLDATTLSPDAYPHPHGQRMLEVTIDG